MNDWFWWIITIKGGVQTKGLSNTDFIHARLNRHDYVDYYILYSWVDRFDDGEGYRQLEEREIVVDWSEVCLVEKDQIGETARRWVEKHEKEQKQAKKSVEEEVPAVPEDDGEGPEGPDIS